MLTGGTRFIGGSVEVRGKVTDKVGVVGFFDYGRITDSRFTAAPASSWHAGAGVGVRYATPVGPIRLDLALPAGGRKGGGLQFYLGIGQAF
jgi:translocation and assembly module TamA